MRLGVPMTVMPTMPPSRMQSSAHNVHVNTARAMHSAVQYRKVRTVTNGPLVKFEPLFVGRYLKSDAEEGKAIRAWGSRSRVQPEGEEDDDCQGEDSVEDAFRAQGSERW